MDRQLLAIGTIALAWLAGCGMPGCAKSPPDKAANNRATSQPSDGSVATHRPVIVSPDSAPHPEPPAENQFAPPEAQPGTAPPPAFSAHDYPGAALPDSVSPPKPTEVEPPPPAGGSALNPLRSAMAPPPPAIEPNPLRTPRSFSPTEPRIRPRSVETSPPPPSEAFPETATPDFAPAAIAPEPTPPNFSEAPPAAAADPGSPDIAPRDSARAGSAENSAGALPLTQPAAPTGPYDVVQVFYGTDRAEVAPLGASLASSALRFVPTACAVLVTLCLGLLALAKRKSGMLWAMVFAGAVVAGGLALQASSTTFTAIRWQDKAGLRYGVERSASGHVQLGVCEVTIPKIHKTGELESPSILRLEVKDDLAKHVALLKTDRLASDEFYAQLKARVAASPRKELFVFVHGFNVTFEDAARRTAQIHKDLNFPGAPIFFSWPANNKFLLTYPADENSITWSTPHLKQFLLDIVKHSDAQSINLIAHSMGNRALTAALREIELEFRDQARLFNNVVLAAPDIDANDFKTNIAPRLQNTAKHFTLYASSRDDALRVSQLLHRGARAGDAGRGLVVVPGIDTIDVSAIDTSPWGHSYYGSSDPVLQDLGMLMAFGFPPQDRSWLSPAERDGLTYWIFEPARTASLPIPPPK